MRTTIIDEKITLPTAKLAKEKGFDVMVKGSYIEYLVDRTDSEYPKGGGPFSMKKGEVETDDSYFVNSNKDMGDYSCESYTMYARPTQTVLQRWLREVKKIDITMNRISSHERKTIAYSPAIWSNITCTYCFSDNVNYESSVKLTYEESLEVALVIALNVI